MSPTERRCRVAHVVPASAMLGGTEHATMRIIQAVKPFGFDSVVFCLPYPGPVRAFFETAEIELATYQHVDPSYRHAFPFLKASWRLAAEYRRRRIDLIHCADLLAAYRTGLAAKLARIPLLCHIRSRYEDISWRDRSFLWPVDKFVFVSRDTWKRFGHTVQPRRGVVVYDGLNVNLAAGNAARDSVRNEFNILEGAKIVGMVARVAGSKDFATLARAAARVIKVLPSTKFLIVGAYSETAESRQYYRGVQRVLQETGVASHFIFTDFRTDVPRLIDGMDVFVLCTHYEGLPLVVLEAMAHGKPVIATAVDGILEVITHERTGMLHDHENDRELGEQILALLQDRVLGDRLADAGRTLLETNFSQQQFALNMATLYTEMLNKPA